MKEIKAYIRKKKAEEVIRAIEDFGVPGFTLIEVKCLGAGMDPDRASFSLEYGEEFCATTKLEVVCLDEDAERLVDIIRKSAYTGHRGDGMIFLSDITGAVKIRTGESGKGSLVPGSDQ
ncbi:MAG: P-II family nitrogen regulator [Thermodesulfobacteriota bacterium]